MVRTSFGSESIGGSVQVVSSMCQKPWLAVSPTTQTAARLPWPVAIA